MTNIVAYNQLPNKDEFIDYYINQNKSQIELAEIYKCGKIRIRKWIICFGLSLRKRASGRSNNKYNISKEEIENYISLGYTDDQIAFEIQMSSSNVKRLIKKFKLGRKYNTSEYKKYCRKVRYYTEFTYAKYIDKLNPKCYPRTLCGVDGGYQLDHIRSVRECFENNISIDECSSIENLQLISWQENLVKRKYNAGRLI